MSHVTRCIFIVAVEKTVLHQDEQPAFLKRRLFYLGKYLILLADVFVFGAECATEAKDKQGQNYEPTCGHK
jgi:hypothetical protein